MGREAIPVEVKECENCPRTFVRPVRVIVDPDSQQLQRIGPKYCIHCRRLSKLTPQPRSEYAQSAWSSSSRKRPDVWEQARRLLRT